MYLIITADFYLICKKKKKLKTIQNTDSCFISKVKIRTETSRERIQKLYLLYYASLKKIAILFFFWNLFIYFCIVSLAVIESWVTHVESPWNYISPDNTLQMLFMNLISERFISSV